MNAVQNAPRQDKPEKESIHSGQFMVSHFEAEEQDDEDNVAVPIPEVTDDIKTVVVPVKKFAQGMVDLYVRNKQNQQQLEIDTSLSKLFQCMSLAYRQKLTSPKWNRFRGIRLRWKDKIRLNNVIWRCWHLQFIKKENTLICQFASPLDVDTHNKPEAVVLEGKYWKRKLAAVTAEYKKCRLFYRNQALGHAAKDTMETVNDLDTVVWDSITQDNMMVDEDYMGLMSDTLFSTITNQPFVFPDTREIAKAGLADFIQPSLGPLQPNLEDYMDTVDPFQDFMTNKLPTVPEEQNDNMYKSVGWGYMEDSDVNVNSLSQSPMVQYQQLEPIPQMTLNTPVPIQDTRQQQQMMSGNYGEIIIPQTSPVDQYNQLQPPPYSTVISKNKTIKSEHAKLEQNQLQTSSMYNKQIDALYQNYQPPMQQTSHVLLDERLQLPIQDQSQNQMSSQQPVPEQQQQHFKLPQSSSTQAYKFPSPSNPNVKFTSQVPHRQFIHHNNYPQHAQYNSSPSVSSQLPSKPDKPEPKRRGAPRGRQRSRSNTREPIKRPPLISAVSDPQLLNPTNSVLLTQLLTNPDNPTNVYNRSLSSGSKDIPNQVRIKEEKTSPVTILKPQGSTLIIQNAVNLNPQPLSIDPLSLNTFSNSNSPIMDSSSQNLNSPTSSQGSIGSPNRDSQRDRRVGHIHAEQKRRYNIKNGFDMIHSLIPHLNQNPNAKLSKAAMLQKGAEYIRQLRAERNQLKEEMDSLRQQIESLNTSISNCQSMLPVTGAPVSRRRDSKMLEMFEEFVRLRTMDNWKYWIFSLTFRPLLNSFNNFVSTSSLDDLYSSTMLWIEQHCTLVDLRPIVLSSLTNLCTITEVLSQPEKLPDEARQKVQKNGQQNNQQ